MIPASQVAKAALILDHVRAALALVDSMSDKEREAGPLSAANRKQIGKLLDFGDTYVPSAFLAEMPEFDVPAMVDRLVTDCPEIDIPDHMVDRVEVVWKKKGGSSGGQTVLATCKPVGKREREGWRGDGPAPWWRLTIALDIWCMLDNAQRWRLIHHELMHATYKGDSASPRSPSGRGHDVEEFAATLARYGLGDITATQATTLGQAMARGTIAEEMRRWDVDPATGQGLLFGLDLAAVGL